MKWQEFMKDYLSFTRKDRIGILIISGLMVIVFFLPQVFSRSSKKRDIQLDTAWLSAVKKLEIKGTDPSTNYDQESEEENVNTYQFDRPKDKYSKKDPGKVELFYFDPNTVSESGWKRLGLRDKTIETIHRYLSKGGIFKKPEDLQRIYGLHPNEYLRLAPFIKIESSFVKSSDELKLLKAETDNQNTKKNSSYYTKIDINTADTSAFIYLPGIGSKLASRIIYFRDKLGGFYSIDQVGETYGLPDSTFQKIKQYLKLENPSVKKININSVTVDELKAHPYIKYSLANPIIAYRNEHGPFSKIEDIKKVMAVTEELYNKISPYLFIQ